MKRQHGTRMAIVGVGRRVLILRESGKRLPRELLNDSTGHVAQSKGC